MGYMHIDNLYKNQDILMHKECYAMEKIHGTSAHIRWVDANKPQLTFFSGGEKHENFIKLFDAEKLSKDMESIGHYDVTIYGEAYGGRCQGMKATYGDQLKFVAFEVKCGKSYLDVPIAEGLVKALGLEFVHYWKTTTDLEELDRIKKLPSPQAKRNGITEDKLMEGIVLRPLTEIRKNNGARVMAKHKNDEFRETKTPRKVDPEKLKKLHDAQAIAAEWVTPMRLAHVLDKIENPCMEKMGEIMGRMNEDIKREGEGEIEWSKPVNKMIRKYTAELTKEYFKHKLKESQK